MNEEFDHLTDFRRSTFETLSDLPRNISITLATVLLPPDACLWRIFPSPFTAASLAAGGGDLLPNYIDTNLNLI